MHSYTYLAFDFGTKYIGVAVGQTITKTANPLITLRAQNGVPDWIALAALIQEWQPTGLIVGLALQLDGSPSKTSQLATGFARQLKKRYKLPVYTIEERLTSVAANEKLKEMRQHGTQLPSQDAVAATIILESWFNQCAKENSANDQKSSI